MSDPAPPPDQDPPPGQGRAVQAAIYRAGTLGGAPPVPTAFPALEAAARRRLSPRAFGYLAGAAGLERTAAADVAGLDRWRVLPRVLRATPTRDLSIELLGRRHHTPFLLAPIGVLGLAHRDADVAVARAAAASHVTMTFSTQASVPMEACAAAMDSVVAGADRWFQLYWSSNDDLVASLLSRAELSGCSAVMVTLDTPMLGWRPRDLDLGFLPFAHGLGLAQYTSDPVFTALARRRAATGDGTGSPPPLPPLRSLPAAVRTLSSMARAHPGSWRANLRSPLPRAAVETFLEVFSRPALRWTDLARLRQLTRLPLVLKGILHPDDARRAVDAGVDAVQVSTHGGRQLDGSIAAIDALPGVVDAVRHADGALPVLFDSGIRSGAHAAVALALGARAVAVGRPYAYGLALAGAEGVRHVLEHLLAELDLTLAMAGVPSVADLDRDLLVDRQRGATDPP